MRGGGGVLFFWPGVHQFGLEGMEYKAFVMPGFSQSVKDVAPTWNMPQATFATLQMFQALHALQCANVVHGATDDLSCWKVVEEPSPAKMPRVVLTGFGAASRVQREPGPARTGTTVAFVWGNSTYAEDTHVLPDVAGTVDAVSAALRGLGGVHVTQVMNLTRDQALQTWTTFVRDLPRSGNVTVLFFYSGLASSSCVLGVDQKEICVGRELLNHLPIATTMACLLLDVHRPGCPVPGSTLSKLDTGNFPDGLQLMCAHATGSGKAAAAAGAGAGASTVFAAALTAALRDGPSTVSELLHRVRTKLTAMNGGSGSGSQRLVVMDDGSGDVSMVQYPLVETGASDPAIVLDTLDLQRLCVQWTPLVPFDDSPLSQGLYTVLFSALQWDAKRAWLAVGALIFGRGLSVAHGRRRAAFARALLGDVALEQRLLFWAHASTQGYATAQADCTRVVDDVGGCLTQVELVSDGAEDRLPSLQLGRGSAGFVSKCQVVGHPSDGRPLCVKWRHMLHAPEVYGVTANNPVVVAEGASVEREARALSRFQDHDCFVRSHGVVRSSAGLVTGLVMDAYDMTLEDFVKMDGALATIHQWFPLAFSSMAKALAYMHGAVPALMHADIKASNVFVTVEDGVRGVTCIRLGDFGSVKVRKKGKEKKKFTCLCD